MNKTNEKNITVNATNNLVKYYKLPYIVPYFNHISIGFVSFIEKI